MIDGETYDKPTRGSLMIRRISSALRLLVLAGTIFVALPWGLTHFVGWPLPRQIPNLATLQDWINHPLTATRFWKGAAIAAWLGWGALVAYLCVQVLAQLGRIRTPRLRIGPLQGLAAALAGASVAVATSGTAHAATAAVTAATVPTAGPGATDHTSPQPSYVVERGDWLSALADRFLGNADAYPQIQALNPDLAARDARFPNHIEPGWRVWLPADAYDRGIRLHAAGAMHRPAPQRAPEQMPPTLSSAPPSGGIHQPPERNNPASNVDGDGDGHPDVIVTQSTSGAMTGAGLLASLLFALLTAERRRQRSLYSAGQQLPRPANGRAERELRIAQQPADVERLDAALRSLAHSLAGKEPPDIVGVRLVGGDVHVLLGHPAEDPPTPWLDEGTQWALPAYLDPPTPHAANPLLPALVTVGSRAGRHLLIDIGRLGTLSITGDPGRGRDLLRHIACELACNTWSDKATIVLAGFGNETGALREIGRDRILAATTVNAAITIARQELTRRAGTGNAAPPFVLLATNPHPTARVALAQLHHDLTAVGQCGIAVVTTLVDAAPIGPAALTLTDAGQLQAHLPGLRLSTDAATLPVDMLEPMTAVFRAAHLAPPIATPGPELPPWDDELNPTAGVLALFVPGPAHPRMAEFDLDHSAALASPPPRDQLDDDLAAWHAAENRQPRIGILGPIEVRMPGALNDSRHRLYTEMLLYLLTRPSRGADRATIEDALWYGQPAGETTVRKVMYKLRQWLGPREDGDWIRSNGEVDGVYHLETGALLDWHLLRRLEKRATKRGRDGAHDLRAALQLVRGVPMVNRRETGPYRRPYTWIGDSDIAPDRIIAAVAGIAHRLAQHHLTQREPEIARWAIGQAWLADPQRGFDDLWHDRMQAEHQAGEMIALRQLVKEYLAANEAEVPEDLPTPIYNRIRELLPSA
jgi:hypothetical protein